MVGQVIMPLMAAQPVALLLQTAQTFPNQMTPDQQFEIARQAMALGRSPAQLLVPLGFFAMIVLIIWLKDRSNQARIRAQGEFRKQLLDKFGSAQELAAFLESKGGQQLLREMQPQAAGQLRFLRGGVIATMLGLALLGLTPMHRNFLVLAVILLSLGIGLLILAAIAHKLASKNGGENINPTSGMQPFPPA